MRVVIDGIKYVPAPKDEDALELVSLRQEREDLVKYLRGVCRKHGDNDWPDNLHLLDVLTKHLLDYMDLEEEES